MPRTPDRLRRNRERSTRIREQSRVSEASNAAGRAAATGRDRLGAAAQDLRTRAGVVAQGVRDRASGVLSRRPGARSTQPRSQRFASGAKKLARKAGRLAAPLAPAGVLAAAGAIERQLEGTPRGPGSPLRQNLRRAGQAVRSGVEQLPGGQEATSFIARRFDDRVRRFDSPGVQLTPEGRAAGEAALRRRGLTGAADRVARPGFGNRGTTVADTDALDAASPAAPGIAEPGATSSAPEAESETAQGEALLRHLNRGGVPARGTGAFQRVDAQGNVVPGSTNVLGLRSRVRQGERDGGAAPRDPTQDRSRFDLRRFLSGAESRGELNTGTAAIAAGALNLDRSLRRGPSLRDRAGVLNAQANLQRAGIEGQRFAREGQTEAFERGNQVLEDLRSDDSVRREQAIGFAATQALRGDPGPADAVRADLQRRVREEFDTGSTARDVIETLLPRILGGRQRGVLDAVQSYFQGDPSVSIAGAFEGYDIKGGVLIAPDGQELANLDDLGSPGVAQALRTLQMLDNPQG